MDTAIDLIDKAIEFNGGAGGEDAEFVRQTYSTLTAMRDSFDVICANLKASEHGEGTMILKDGGGLLDAYVDLVMLNLGATESANDNAEATKIINDLRNLKAACLLFYGDNLRWPAQDDLEELDNFMDRPIVASGRYEKAIIGPEYEDAAGNKRANVGLALRPENNGAAGIRWKLAARARDTGLLNGEDNMEPYEVDSMTVYMNMR